MLISADGRWRRLRSNSFAPISLYSGADLSNAPRLSVLLHAQFERQRKENTNADNKIKLVLSRLDDIVGCC
jgi:hypothetical protein